MFQQLTPTVKKLLGINILVFILNVVGILPQEPLALHYFESKNFHFYQIVTYLFIHSSLMHLISNMFGLFMFGSLLERLWGKERFTFFYFFCGIGAGLLYMGIQYYIDFDDLRRATQLTLSDPNTINLSEYWNRWGRIPLENGLITPVSVTQNYQEIVSSSILGGASGAIFGIIMAFGYLFPNSEMYLFPFPIPIKAKWFVTLYGMYEMYSGIERSSGDNVAHFAHVGGMLFAIILLKIWKTRRNNFY
jgi:membrane associated rhomboid family serine protease